MIRQEMESQEQERQLADAWASVLATPQGRMIMADIMNRAGIYSTTFTGSSNGMFLEGRRALGLEVMQAYLVPQGAQVHSDLLMESEERALRMAVAKSEDGRHEDE